MASRLYQQTLGFIATCEGVINAGHGQQLLDQGTHTIIKTILEEAKKQFPQDPVLSKLDLDPNPRNCRWIGAYAIAKIVAEMLSEQEGSAVYAPRHP
jgi:hypothetical protein